MDLAGQKERDRIVELEREVIHLRKLNAQLRENRGRVRPVVLANEITKLLIDHPSARLCMNVYNVNEVLKARERVGLLDLFRVTYYEQEDVIQLYFE